MGVKMESVLAFLMPCVHCAELTLYWIETGNRTDLSAGRVATGPPHFCVVVGQTRLIG